MAKKILSRIDPEGNATVVLNRPEVHNAFDPEMVEELSENLRELDVNPGVRAVVLLGAGRNFCAGADIAHMKQSATYSRRQNFRVAQHAARMFYTLNGLGKPTIACVRGAARGGGVGLIAACDIAIAARDATFRLSEVKLGIIPAMISPYVIAAIGERMARRYMLSGEEFDAAEAFRIGLIHDIAEEEDLNARVGRMLAHLHSSGPRAVAAIKALIPVSARVPLDDAIVDETARRIAALRATREAQEGLAAFLEKRKPSWITPAPMQPKRGKRTSAAKQPLTADDPVKRPRR
jgi:methylglutaconyl-CoA hydratase